VGGLHTNWGRNKFKNCAGAPGNGRKVARKFQKGGRGQKKRDKEWPRLPSEKKKNSWGGKRILDVARARNVGSEKSF